MTASKYKTYWIVNGERLGDFNTVEQRVLAGSVAVEVSAERQRRQAELLERREKQMAIEAEERQRRLDQQEHQNSPEGQREAALRTAMENPGGIVTTGVSPLVELDKYSAERTNIFK